MKLILLAIILALSLITCFPQSQKTSDTKSVDFWINLPSSPVIIYEDSQPFSSYIKNITLGSISQYQFGCVVKKENGLLEIKSEAKTEDFYIGENPPEKFNYFPKSAHGSYLRGICSGDAKLAVIEVKFTDGAKWTIKQQLNLSSQCLLCFKNYPF